VVIGHGYSAIFENNCPGSMSMTRAISMNSMTSTRRSPARPDSRFAINAQR
jgi:hypothetical protein